MPVEEFPKGNIEQFPKEKSVDFPEEEELLNNILETIQNFFKDNDRNISLCTMIGILDEAQDFVRNNARPLKEE